MFKRRDIEKSTPAALIVEGTIGKLVDEPRVMRALRESCLWQYRVIYAMFCTQAQLPKLCDDPAQEVRVIARRRRRMFERMVDNDD
jgi:hypothetical protein